MKYCSACGYIAEGNVGECPYCGEVLVEKQPSAAKSERKREKPNAEQSVLTKYADFVGDEALYRLAVMKLDGTDDERKDGVEILRALAFRGYYDGMYKLADYLLALDPPEQNTAYMWLKIAADSGHEPSKIRLRVLGTENADAYSAYSSVNVAGCDSDFVARVRAVLPSIVTVTATFVGKGNKTACSCGSGFIVQGGYVVTNAHVVTAKPQSIIARFEPSIDERCYNLEPLLTDVDCDIAILRFTGLKNERVSAQDNLFLRMGDLQFGEDVYTVGNPLGLGLSVSRGVISCPSRESDYPVGVDHVVQTDISANHGNSGGALLDVHNSVIGMVTFLPGDAKGGIAMCVPTDYIVKALNKIN